MERQWHSFTVVPSLPERLAPLERLAWNLWYTWNPEAIELWRRLDRDLWEQAYHNPVRMLGMISQEKLEEAAHNESFLSEMEQVAESFGPLHGKQGHLCVPPGETVGSVVPRRLLFRRIRPYRVSAVLFGGDWAFCPAIT